MVKPHIYKTACEECDQTKPSGRDLAMYAEETLQDRREALAQLLASEKQKFAKTWSLADLARKVMNPSGSVWSAVANASIASARRKASNAGRAWRTLVLGG